MADNKHYEVEKILDKSSINDQVYYLIRWKGFGSEWDTWEPVDNLIDCLQLVLDFDAAKEKSSQLLDSSLEAVARGIPSPSPKKDGKTKSKSSSISKNSKMKSHVSSKKKSPNSPRKSPYKVSVESVKGVKDEKLRMRLAREKGKLFIDMKAETFIPTKNESGQGPREGERLKVTSGNSSEGQKSPKRDASPRSPRKNEGNDSPKKDTEYKLKTDDVEQVDTKSAEKDLKMDKNQSSSKRKEEKDTNKKSLDKDSTKESKKITKTSAAEKVIRDKKYKKSVKYAMKVKLKPTGKVKKESDKKDKKKKDKEEVKKPVQKKVSKEESKSDDRSEVKKKVKTSQSGKNQKTEKLAEKATKEKQNGDKAKKSKATKRKVEEDYHIVECSTSDTDDEPLCNMKVKKLKKSSSDSSFGSKKKDAKKVSPKSKSGQDGNSQAVKVKPKQLTVNNMKRKLEVRVQPLGSTSKSKTMRLIDSKNRGKEMAKVQPVSPKISSSYTTVKPVTISGVGIVNLVVDADLATPLSGDVPGNQYLPSVTPVSPSSVSYKSLLDNMPLSLLAKKGGGKKKDSDDTSEDDQERVERRISVRQSECAYRYKDIVVRKCQRYTQIWLNTHTKIKNVLNPQVIQETLQALNSAKYDDSSLILFSGLGNVFCNGVDLMFLLSGEKRVVVRQMVDALRDFTKALITFPKPVIAVVNGPAVGLGMAMLPLCDIVYASDKATFYLPYSALSQTPEGCASYTLPQSVGMAMANELLLAGRKVTAIEACQLGLVSQVFWPTSMMQEVIPKIQNIALHSAKALETTKLLLRSHQRTKLELTCESESNILLERWQSSECQKSIQAFLNKEDIYSS
ncbi:chromodomain Y-like protein [Saccostrea cucullata]|uniref:chromodomain Y-like protein n=1 Tax=Saccostrea cuccullata TaxID=36930 RepID=UPI002ED25292